MPNLLLVMIGGAIGAGFRYHIGQVALEQMGPGFPWGTLIVNLLGGLLIGVLAGMAVDENPADRPLWLFMAVGVLGGFTTFSAFSFDLFEMAGRREFALAAAYAVASVAGSLTLLFGGFWLARSGS